MCQNTFCNNTPLYASSVHVLSLARATLVLIPLLGIHEVVFTVLVDECVEGSSRYARNFINLTLSSFQVTPVKLPTYKRQGPCCSESTLNISCASFQGFLVAVLYCFANGEVRHSKYIYLYINIYVWVCVCVYFSIIDTRNAFFHLHFYNFIVNPPTACM